MARDVTTWTTQASHVVTYAGTVQAFKGIVEFNMGGSMSGGKGANWRIDNELDWVPIGHGRMGYIANDFSLTGPGRNFSRSKHQPHPTTYPEMQCLSGSRREDN